SASLQKYSWDAESGYFGYVMHDQSGKPSGILRTAGGVNFNMGLGGVSPLISGICSPEQTERILDLLFSARHMWTEIGITTVDQAAPYYRPDGYWNGSVWFAHQWFLWKTMLDLGRGDLALRIAQAGLAIWKQVTDASYDCMEHFAPRPPFGAGWIQFSSLSSPALSWFAALYTPGRFTCGFDTWIEQCRFSDGNRHLQAKLSSSANQSSLSSTVLACMHSTAEYQVTWNGEPAHFTVAFDGLLQIQIPAGQRSGLLVVSTNSAS
ncbi:MAG: MGH1-like glycoside hydrolase domain-containing protein, partial [Bryobacteraceae bacterium]